MKRSLLDYFVPCNKAFYRADFLLFDIYPGPSTLDILVCDLINQIACIVQFPKGGRTR